jgi:hypothetical protein
MNLNARRAEELSAYDFFHQCQRMLWQTPCLVKLEDPTRYIPTYKTEVLRE